MYREDNNKRILKSNEYCDSVIEIVVAINNSHYDPNLFSRLILKFIDFTSWRKTKYIAIFPSHVWVCGITPRSIWGTAVRVMTQVRVIFGFDNIFRDPPVTMRTLGFPRLTHTTRPGDVHISMVTKTHSIVTI